jgi:hypothetical protein
MNDAFAYRTFEYLSKFEHHIVLNCGESHNSKFKEVYHWCSDHLGVRYKDWFMMNNSTKGQILHVNDTKWITMLQLTFPEVIVHSYKM